MACSGFVFLCLRPCTRIAQCPVRVSHTGGKPVARVARREGYACTLTSGIGVDIACSAATHLLRFHSITQRFSKIHVRWGHQQHRR